jgi:hypothetical protein
VRGDAYIDPMSFTDNGDGTVTDNKTGLMWQKEDDGNSYNWLQAMGVPFSHDFYPDNPLGDNYKNVCLSLALGGYADWRLPSKKELTNIVDYSMPAPMINPIFTNTKSDDYLTSTPKAGYQNDVWKVPFSGYLLPCHLSMFGYDYVRCVRGGQVGVITDLNITGPDSLNEQSIGLYAATASLRDGSTIKVRPTWFEDSAFASINDVGVLTAVMVTGNQSVTITATYTADAITKTATKSVTIIDMFSSNMLTITKSGNGNGRITSLPTGIDCGSVCSVEYPQGTVITLTAEPDTDSVFTGWSGGGCSGTGTCITNLNNDTSINANFTAVQAGVPKISVKPTALNFGLLKAGGTSGNKTITIKNAGKGSLIINSVALSGINASEFSQINDCTTVSEKSSCTVSVIFAPTTPYSKKNALISIFSNDTKKPTINVKLLGQVPPPKISVRPSSVNWGKRMVGEPSSLKVVTVKNTGLSDLVLSSIDINGINAPEFSQINDCATIANGSSCTVTLIFSPTSTGSKSATLDISTNDPKKPNYTVKVSGKGI